MNLASFSLDVAYHNNCPGSIIRITPNELHISDPAFYNEIYTGQSNPRDKYAPFYRFTGATRAAFETHDHKLHNLRRQPLMNAFSKRSIVNIEPLILEKINLLAKKIRKGSSSRHPHQIELGVFSSYG
jgi:hypothetical protein